MVPNKETVTKRTRHHFIPQFYLRGFVDPSSPKDHVPYLWVYRRGQAEPQKRAPKNVAVISHFYSVDVEGVGRDSRVEDLLSRIESEVAPICRRLRNSEDALSEEDRAALAKFIAWMYFRVPGVRETRDNVFDDLSQLILQMTDAHYEDFPPEQREAIGLSREELKQAISGEERHFQASQAVHLWHTLRHAERFVPLFLKMNWAFLHSPQGSVFVTSDCPVVPLNPQLSTRVERVGIATPGVEVTFPVSAHLCLLLTWEGPTAYVDIGEHKVAQINSRTAELATREVYAPARLGWLDELFARDIPPGS